MSERKWPILKWTINREITPQRGFQEWLEANLTEAELDRIAPKKCKHELAFYMQDGEIKAACKDCYSRFKPTGWEEV
jgi:hypothetical protein